MKRKAEKCSEKFKPKEDSITAEPDLAKLAFAKEWADDAISISKKDVI